MFKENTKEILHENEQENKIKTLELIEVWLKELESGDEKS